MENLLVIPARMGSSRFPGKPLAKILGKSMLQRVYENASSSLLVKKTVIATCDEVIREEALSFGAEVVMTSDRHVRATDRTYEAFNSLKNMKQNFDFVLMLQGDEPCVTGQMIDLQLAQLRENPIRKVTNLIGEIRSREDHENPNTIKVVHNSDGQILYFSREPIPGRGNFEPEQVGKQVCSISFTPEALSRFAEAREAPLERAESIDMLRFMDLDIPVFGIQVQGKTHAVDVKSDIAIVERILSGLEEPGL